MIFFHVLDVLRWEVEIWVLNPLWTFLQQGDGQLRFLLVHMTGNGILAVYGLMSAIGCTSYLLHGWPLHSSSGQYVAKP